MNAVSVLKLATHNEDIWRTELHTSTSTPDYGEMTASRSGLLNPGRKSRAQYSLSRMKVETSAGLDNFGKREISFPQRAAKADYSVVQPVKQSLYRANPVPTLRICIFQKHKTFYNGKVCQIPKEFLHWLLCIMLGAFVSLRRAN
jgi:hypothetical protein